VFADVMAAQPRVGQALDSVVCPGCIVSGGQVRRSVLSPNVRINSWATVADSILFDGVEIGRHTRIRRAIIDKGVKIPERMEIGFDVDQDRARGFTVTDTGIVVIAKTDAFDIDESPDEWASRVRSHD
jgi:glucose-1-phosphate adenylyltransferase